MRKMLVVGMVGVLLLVSPGAWSQEEPKGPSGMGMEMMGGGGGMKGGGRGGMMGMGHGMMRMMGPAMKNPEIVGTMMMMHGEMIAAIGEITRKYKRMGEAKTPQMREEMDRELMVRIGEILLKYGQLMKEKGERLSQ